MPATITADDAAGDTITELATDYAIAFPGVPLRTPSANFSFGWNGVLTDYVLGQPAVVSADQFAAMTAAGCPIA
jgi:hypothetical protein